MGCLSTLVVAGILAAIAPPVSAAAVSAAATAEVTAAFVSHQIMARAVYCEMWIAADDNATCLEFASEWSLSMAQFKALNPTVVCPALAPDTLYCILGSVTGMSTSGTIGPNRTPTTVSYTLPTSSGGPSSVDIAFPTHPTTTSTTSKTLSKTSTSITPTTTAGNKPAPTQAGLAAACNNFHLVVKGDSCTAIESSYGVTPADFFLWTPAVQSNCLGLLTEYYVCVGVSGASTSVASTTSAAKSTSTSTAPETSTTPETSTDSKTSTAPKTSPASKTSSAVSFVSFLCLVLCLMILEPTW